MPRGLGGAATCCASDRTERGRERRRWGRGGGGGPLGLEVNLLNGRLTKLDGWLRERESEREKKRARAGGGACSGTRSASSFFHYKGYLSVFLLFLFCFFVEGLVVFFEHGGVKYRKPLCHIFA